MRPAVQNSTSTPKKDRRLFFLTGLTIAAIVLLCRLVYVYLGDPVRFPISTIKIIAPYRHISHQQLETILSKYSEESFFILSVHRLYQDLMQLPWVHTIDIERQWPDSIKITIKEQRPIALWNGEILTHTGTTIQDKTAIQEFAQLPHLSGPPSNQTTILKMYQSINPLLQPIHLRIDALFQRDNQAWEASLDNGITLKLGKKDTYERMTRFIKAYPLLSSHPEGILSIDLRYPKGMAVQWKQAAILSSVQHEPA
jgi:cell division protein FtsQ